MLAGASPRGEATLIPARASLQPATRPQVPAAAIVHVPGRGMAPSPPPRPAWLRHASPTHLPCLNCLGMFIWMQHPGMWEQPVAGGWQVPSDSSGGDRSPHPAVTQGFVSWCPSGRKGGSCSSSPPRSSAPRGVPAARERMALVPAARAHHGWAELSLPRSSLLAGGALLHGWEAAEAHLLRCCDRAAPEHRFAGS